MGKRSEQEIHKWSINKGKLAQPYEYTEKCEQNSVHSHFSPNLMDWQKIKRVTHGTGENAGKWTQ